MSNETAFEAILGLVQEPEAREELLRFHAQAGLAEDDALFVLAYSLALAVRIPNDGVLDKGRSLADSCGTLAVRLESLRNSLEINQGKLAKAGDAIVQALEPLIVNLNNCATVVRQVSGENAEMLKKWNEAMTSIQRAERDIVAAAVGAARAEADKSKLGMVKVAALAGVAASVMGGPMGVLVLKIFGVI